MIVEKFNIEKNELMNEEKKKKKKSVFIGLELTWGISQNLIGVTYMTRLSKTEHSSCNRPIRRSSISASTRFISFSFSFLLSFYAH